MKMISLFLQSITGLFPVFVSNLRTVPHKYDLMEKSVTWPDSQNYCRVMYTDLATILSDTDWLRLKTKAASKSLTPAWTGLYKDIYNWHWSLNELPLKNVSFTNWYPGQPDNFWGNEACSIIGWYYYWWDVPCLDSRPFICYNANFSDAKKFIAISNLPMTWPDAQAYCRTHYTDLASSFNSSDQNMLAQIQHTQGDSWIGLHRDMGTWKWSDGTNALNIPWNPGQPDNAIGSENCAVVYNGHFYDERCTNLHYFYCETIFPNRGQIMRLQVESDGSVFDPSVHSSILNQIKHILKDNGMLENTTVTWRVQPDENIFHKKKKKDEL